MTRRSQLYAFHSGLRPISSKNIWPIHLDRFVYPVRVGCSILARDGFSLLESYPINRLDQWLMWTIVAGIYDAIAGIGLITATVIAKLRLGLWAKHSRDRNLRRHNLFCTAAEPR
jgi:hypothetical protein